MLSYIPSYYLLHRLSRESWSKQTAARLALEALSLNMAMCLRDYLFVACLGEARHALSKIGRGYEGFDGKERDQIYERSHKFAINPENVQSLIDLFYLPDWGEKPGYGGAKWGDLAVLVSQYSKLSPVLYVDAVVNAQHNGGTAFSKSEAAHFVDIDFNLDFSKLRPFLDYRREAADILASFTTYFRSVSLTAGKLAIAHHAEIGSKLDTRLLLPLPDHEYQQHYWGKEKLPQITRRSRSCVSCGKKSDDHIMCPKCHMVYCSQCYGDSDYCKSCESSPLGRCLVCLGRIKPGHEIVISACGYKIHAACQETHIKQCDKCYPAGKTTTSYKTYARCAVCHTLITDGLESWMTFKNDPSHVHKHCYHMHPNADHDASDYDQSLELFNEIAYHCAICNLPVLKGTGQDVMACEHFNNLANPKFHRHCAEMHRVTCQDTTLCDCESCSTKNSIWKKLAKEAGYVEKEQA